jgi:signal transduction histidine kinase/CheY-like chemotaxis protein
MEDLGQNLGLPSAGALIQKLLGQARGMNKFVDDFINVEKSKSEKGESVQKVGDIPLVSLVHELRTQLQIIISTLTLSSQTEFITVKTAYNQIAKFLKHMGQAEREGKLVYNEVSFDLEAMCKAIEAQANAYPAARDKSVTVKITLSCAPLTYDLRSDQLQLEGILYNLISNAIKYSKEGQTVLVDVGISEGWGGVRFDVYDEGEGIEPSKLGNLFKLFSQVDANSSSSDKPPSSGVGLDFCREVVALLNGGNEGNIFAHSDGLGRGSRFWFTIPLKTSPKLAQAPAAAASESSTPLPKYVGKRDPIFLVADDSNANLRITKIMVKAGMKVPEAPRGVTNGDLAVQAFQDAIDAGQPYDIVVLDNQMPAEDDGLKAARKIREFCKQTSWQQPLIFLLSGDELAADKITKITAINNAYPEAAGITYLKKPIEPPEFVKAVNALWRLKISD